MSTAAVLLVKDELDILPSVLPHMLAQVDQVIVSDNMSTDGTREWLHDCDDDRLLVLDDLEPAYYQSRKTTELAMRALDAGHSWVVPCDADEVWYVQADPERRIADYLAGTAPDVQIVKAELYNHIPTASDPPAEFNELNENGEKISGQRTMVERIGWRKREHGALPKVACRLHHELVIHAGNHSAYYPGVALAVDGLCIRHFSWRTAEQYLLKLRNGERAYAASDLPEGIGTHWRMFAEATDETIREHFDRWFFSRDPELDDSLIYDPAPVMA